MKTNFRMLTEEKIKTIIQQNTELLKAEKFFLCGPEPVIVNAKNALQSYGVEENKIVYELFTTPELLKSPTVTPEKVFSGDAEVSVILDDEEETFTLAADGDTILEEAESHGMDAPYSCRGGVCSTCKAKVLEGSATMDKNFTLSDEEVEEGYILTCQAHPNSEKLVVYFKNVN